MNQTQNKHDITIINGFLGPDYIDYFWGPNMSRQELALYIQKQIEDRDERKKLQRNEEMPE